MIRLREIEELDIKTIFDWRNHPSVRKMMFDSSELIWEKHFSFWMKLLSDDFVVKYIIEKENESCGVIRLDLDKSKTVGEIDIFINPAFHGQGIGTLAVKELINNQKDKDLRKIVAQVIPET
jgi:UDP-4-amino-4,6-dideoxy-N-acetyl-beta-L-altrosamine N-acetyltransferase